MSTHDELTILIKYIYVHSVSVNTSRRPTHRKALDVEYISPKTYNRCYFLCVLRINDTLVKTPCCIIRLTSPQIFKVRIQITYDLSIIRDMLIRSLHKLISNCYLITILSMAVFLPQGKGRTHYIKSFSQQVCNTFHPVMAHCIICVFGIIIYRVCYHRSKHSYEISYLRPVTFNIFSTAPP